MEYPPQDYESRILDFEEGDNGEVKFKVDKKTQFKDIAATLRYLNPDEESVARQITCLLENALKMGALANRAFLIVDESPHVMSEQAQIQRAICFGPKPTMDDVQAAYHVAYGRERAPAMIRNLAEIVIDEGIFKAGTSIKVTPKNEITTATPEAIEQEMRLMTEEFHRDL